MMKEFQDLVFRPENGDPFECTFKAISRFTNGYGVSVVSGKGTLTDSDKPYELAVVQFFDGDSYRLIYLSLFDFDVVPYLTADEVTSYMKIIQTLPELF